MSRRLGDPRTTLLNGVTVSFGFFVCKYNNRKNGREKGEEVERNAGMMNNQNTKIRSSGEMENSIWIS